MKLRQGQERGQRTSNVSKSKQTSFNVHCFYHSQFQSVMCSDVGEYGDVDDIDRFTVT